MAGRAISGTVTRSDRDRLGATTHSYPAASLRSPDAPTTGIAAEIDELTELLSKLGALRDSGILTPEDLTSRSDAFSFVSSGTRER